MSAGDAADAPAVAVDGGDGSGDMRAVAQMCIRDSPTTDFAKENLFNVLGNLVDFEECDVLDLFAGTGSISYEFASRGARSVTAVEINPVHYNFIRQTAAQLGIGSLHAVKANAFLYLKNCNKPVSYTHLDVYKRQRLSSSSGQQSVIRM